MALIPIIQKATQINRPSYVRQRLGNIKVTNKSKYKLNTLDSIALSNWVGQHTQRRRPSHTNGKQSLAAIMTAFLNLPSFSTVLLLTICTSSYLKLYFPGLVNAKNAGFTGILGKFAVIGDRLSPYVSLCCLFCAFWTLLFR